MVTHNHFFLEGQFDVQLAHEVGEQNDVPKKEVSLLVEHAVP